jgi:hypothetical protein
MTNLIERSIANPYQMAMTSITTFYPPRPQKGDDGKGKGKLDGDDGKKKGGAMTSLSRAIGFRPKKGYASPKLGPITNSASASAMPLLSYL